MADPIRISAKTLGALAQPDFCPRCFWIKRRAEKLPYQIFPGIFNSIDSYGKNLVHSWFDRHGAPPPWLAALGAVKSYEKPPHHSSFQTLDDETNILLTGSPDGVLVRSDGSRIIIDYKTSKFTEFQDSLFPMYEGQLNAYAHIGERKWRKPISGLALIYTEPVTDDAAAGNDENMIASGFRLPFSSYLRNVDRNPDLVPSLLRKVQEVLGSDTLPISAAGCKDCERLANLIRVASG